MRGLGRLRRLGRRLEGRLRRPSPVPGPAEILAGALLPEFLAADLPDVDALRAAFRPVHDPEALEAIALLPGADLGLSGIAGGILDGRQPFLDHGLAQDPIPDWRQVPGAGRWPMMPSSAYDHADFTAHGDVRLLWELGRLQSAPTLAAAARLSDADARLAAAFDLLDDFRAANPIGWGPHWVAGLESGLRVFSLLWTWQLAPSLTDEHTLLLAASLLENGRFTAAHLSEKENANNHLLGEAAALYCLGCALPVFAESAEWRARGLAILERELPLQVLPDGVLAEQAIEYHRFVLEFLVQALLWGRAVGDAGPEAWRERMADMLTPLASLTGPDGRLVSLGDDDSGRILRLDDRHRRDARGLLALGTHLLCGSEIGPFAAEFTGEALWLGGAALAEERPRVDGLTASTEFNEAGWYVARFGEVAGEAGLPGGHLVFKAGPMGRGGAGHGHADGLSICLSMDGRPLLVDPGTYLYNGPQHWRDHFRGASAHNLLRVGDGDPARPHPAPDRFGWARKSDTRRLTPPPAEPRLPVDWSALREGDRDPSGRALRVTRRVIRPARAVIVVVDRVRGEGAGEALPMELRWQAAEGLELGDAPEPTLACDDARMATHALTLVDDEAARLWVMSFAPAGLESYAHRGDAERPAGWISPGYDELRPALAFGLAGNGLGPVPCVSILACPRNSGLETIRLKGGPEGDFVLEILRKGAEINEIELSPGEGTMDPSAPGERS